MTRRKVTLDPAISVILGEAQKKEAARQRAKRSSPDRLKVTYDGLDATIVELVKKVASAVGVSPVGVVNCLLLDALQRWADGRIEFEQHLQPSRGSRYPWVVEVETNGLRAAVEERLTEGVRDDREKKG